MPYGKILCHMVNVDFIVYDNIFLFNKHVPFKGNPLSRLEIKEVGIPENGAFWFWTDPINAISNMNIHAPYVHLHSKVESINRLQMKQPKMVTKDMMKYNPKTRKLEIRASVLPWKKPIWTKTVQYYGMALPDRKINALGTWYYDYPFGKIYIVLDYFSEPKGFKVHFEEDDTPELVNPNTAEIKSNVIEPKHA